MKIDGVKLLKDFCEKFDVYETVGTKDVIRFLIDHLDDVPDSIAITSYPINPVTVPDGTTSAKPSWWDDTYKTTVLCQDPNTKVTLS